MQVYFAHSASAVSGNIERKYLSMMPPGIPESILRYKRWQDRQATLFGKLLLLRALRTKFPDAAIQKFRSMGQTRDGKPFIPGGPQFNISHSEDIVVLTITKSTAVGIDIEKIRPINVDDFLQYVPEIAGLQEKTDSDHVQKLFFDCWTKKEAVLKAYGTGLLAPLEQVAIKDDTALFQGIKWFIKQVLIDRRYCCHIATNQLPGQVAVEHVDLMSGAFQSQN